MALATYHSDRGEKSALIMVKANKFEFSPRPAYVSRKGVEGLEVGDSFQIPDGYKFVDIVDSETGEIRTTKDGIPLQTLVW
jgi:hypothetical protein